MSVLIIGGGIGGLTLALSLHQAGIACRVYEAAPAIQAIGVGINLLPHGMRELTELGLQDKLASVAVETRELCFYNRFGQLIYTDPRGRFAGYDWPQFSIHRADLHEVLLTETRKRLGNDSVALNMKCLAFVEEQGKVKATFQNGTTVEGSCLVGCDG